MNIQFNRAGTWQEVSQSELIELVRAGTVLPDTEVIVNGEKVAAATIDGISFPSDAAVSPQVGSNAAKIFESAKQNGKRFLRWVLPILKKGGEKAVEVAKKGGETAVDAAKKAAPHIKTQLNKIPVQSLIECAIKQLDKIPGGRKRLAAITGTTLLVLIGGMWMMSGNAKHNANAQNVYSAQDAPNAKRVYDAPASQWQPRT